MAPMVPGPGIGSAHGAPPWHARLRHRRLARDRRARSPRARARGAVVGRGGAQHRRSSTRSWPRCRATATSRWSATSPRRASVEAAIDALRRARRAAWTCSSPTPGSRTTSRSCEQPLEAAERMTAVNWLGTVYTVHAGLPPMLAAGHGHVVVVVQRGGAARLPERCGLRRDEGGAAGVRRGAASRARRDRRVADDGLPRRGRDLAARPREGPDARLVPRRARRRSGRRARRGDRRGRRPPTTAALFFPRIVRVLGVLNAITPPRRRRVPARACAALGGAAPRAE